MSAPQKSTLEKLILFERIREYCLNGFTLQNVISFLNEDSKNLLIDVEIKEKLIGHAGLRWLTVLSILNKRGLKRTKECSCLNDLEHKKIHDLVLRTHIARCKSCKSARKLLLAILA